MKQLEEFSCNYVPAGADELACCPRFLSRYEKSCLLVVLCGDFIGLLERLKGEVSDLDVSAYYDAYYPTCRRLYCDMCNNYPEADMSSNDIDVLYKRLHMNE